MLYLQYQENVLGYPSPTSSYMSIKVMVPYTKFWKRNTTIKAQLKI